MVPLQVRDVRKNTHPMVGVIILGIPRPFAKKGLGQHHGPVSKLSYGERYRNHRYADPHTDGPSCPPLR